MADASAGPVRPVTPEDSKVVIAPVKPVEAPAPLDEVSAVEPPTATCDSPVPDVEHSGPLTGRNTVNLSQQFVGRLGGAFSFMCTLTMEGIDSWTRVFDFSLQADEDSITCGAIDLTLNLHFTVFRGRKPISVRVDNFFELGKEFTMLCTVSDAGHMRVFKDGVLAGEKEDGLAPLLMERPRMFVGGHFQFHNQTFRGSIKDVKVWNREVSWPALAAAPAETAEDLKAPPAEEPGKGLDDAPDAPAQELPEAPGPAPGTEPASTVAEGEGDESAGKGLDDEAFAAELLAAGEGDEGAGKPLDDEAGATEPSLPEVPCPAPGSDAGPAAGEAGEGAPAAGAA